MKRIATLAFVSLSILTLVGTLTVVSRPAYAQVQGSVSSYVKLQAVPPGTPQTGNVNISGFVQATRMAIGGPPSQNTA